MMTGIEKNKGKGTGFALKRLVASLLVLIQCASLAFVGVPVAYAEENLAPQDAVETVTGGAKQDPPPAQLPASDPVPLASSNPVPGPANQPAVSGGGVLEADLGSLHVSVGFGADAGIPDGAFLRVRAAQLPPVYETDMVPGVLYISEAEQAAYRARMLQALSLTDSDLVFAQQYLTLEILDADAKPVTPASLLNVCIRFPQATPAEAETWAAVSFDETGAFGTENTTTVLTAASAMEYEGCTLRFALSDLPLIGLCSSARQWLNLQSQYMDLSVYGPANAFLIYDPLYFTPERGSLLLEAYSLNASSPAPCGATALWASVSAHGTADGQGLWLSSLNGTEPAAVLSETGSTYGFVYLDGANGLALFTPDLSAPLYADDSVILDGTVPPEVTVTVEDVSALYADFDLASLVQPEPVVQAAPLFAGWRKAFQMLTNSVPEQTLQAASPRYELIGAYDITLWLANETYQPEPGHPIRVHISDPAIAAANNLQLWHLHDDGSRERIYDFTVEGSTLSFDASGFSVYLVIGEDAIPRCTYTFWEWNQEEKSYKEIQFTDDTGNTSYTQTVKAGEMPIIPQLPASANQEFKGWYEGHFEGRELVLAESSYDFSTPITEDCAVDLYAVFTSYVDVLFHGQYDSGSGEFPVAFTRRGELDSGSATVTISDLSVTYTAGSSGEDMAFCGWSYTPISTPGAERDDAGNPVAPIDGDSITVTENTSLYPVFQRIHWLTFYAAQSGSGASYNAPRYYFVDQAESGPLPVSQRDGYAFLGWYTGTLSTETVDGEQVETVSYGTPITDAYGNIEHVSTYDAGIELINGVMYLRGSATLYAKWEAKDAEYRIVIRKQSASDAADLPEAEKSYEYMESVKLSAPVGTSVSVPEEYKQKTYPGYSYARCDAETTVAADGSTVLYVYYDKNSDYTPGGTYTLRFVDPYRTEPLAEHTGISYQAPLASYEPAAPESARPGYEFTRWYLDEFCTVPADPDTMTMPDHDLTFYAGWDLIWYLVKIDPNYGSLATLDGAGSPVGSGSTWFWKTVEDEPIGEYSYVTRDYEESSSGEYFYVLHDRAYYGYSDAYEAGESSDRFSYYVRDPGQATEDKTFDYVPGIYSYAGWYEVHEDGSETPYVFGSPVDHNTTLRLHWKKNGIYFLAFSATNIAGDVSGLLENGQAVEEIGTPYEDNAGVVLDRVAIEPPGGGYTFIGWQVRGDESGRIYTPGENFILHADDAVRIGGKEVVYLHAVYVQVGTARIVYDFNGGTLNGDFDFGSPTKPGATSLAADGKSAEVFNIVNNSEFTLSSGAGLTRTNAVFKGWRDPVSMAIYEPGQTVGVDTAEPVTLVAAWEVKVNYHLNSADAAWGSGDWSGYEETDGVKSKRVLIGDTVDEPSAVPVYSGADGRMFRFWTTEPEGTTAYDFSAPVTDELQLYACWSAPIEVPVHAVDASAETLTEQTGWVLPNAAIPVGEDSVTLNAATAAQYVTLPSGEYSFAFAAALNQAATRDNVSEADAVASIYYNQDARHLYLRYADAGREDVSLDENTEIYFFYYQKKELSIAYKRMLSTGELQDVSATGAPEATGILLGEYDMASHITQPLGWVGDSTLTNYAFAIGSAGVTNASGLSLITATSDSDDSRPPLLVENSWSGFHYSEDDGASWTSCGFDPTLYVVYFEQQPTVLMFHESTVGSSEILHTEFIFDLLVTETQKVTVSVQHQQLVDGSWVNVGKPTQTENSTTSKLFDTQAAGNQPYSLKDGEASSATLFYSSSTVETPGAESTEGDVTVRDLTVTTTVISQTAEITQTANPAFSTAIDGRLQTAEPYSYSYTSDGSGGTKSVTFTNTHKAIDVELHVALAEAGGLMGRDAFRSGTEANYRFQLPLGGSMKLPDTLPADRLFIGDSTVYAFGAVLAGKGEEGSHITDVLMGIASIAYSQIEGNEYGLILKDSSGNTLGTLDGQKQLYYLYYPMPRIEYVKLGDNGSLTPIGLQEEEYADPVITYNGAPLTMNGQTVEQGQRIEISLGDFVISQSGNNFRMPPVLDDGTFRRYLGYTYIAVGDQGVRTLGGLSAEPSPDLTMHLHLRENELGSMTLQFSYDGETWVDLPLTGSPTVYAIYTERGYDLQISKSLLIPDSEKTNPIFAGRTFTVTIESDAIKYAEYEAEGADSATVTATPATDFAPGSIVLTVEDGTRIRIKGLDRGEYTITETENTNFVLTARRGSITAQTPPYTTVENNSTVTLGESNPLDSDTQVILINSPQELCRIVDNGTVHIFYTLRSAVKYIEENIASYTATIEMLTESYVIPAGDSVEIPNGFNVTLKTADSMSDVATITRGEDLTDTPVFTNNGSLTISELHLDGAGLDSTAPMIRSGGTQLTLGASSSIRNVSSIDSGGAISATAGDVTLSGTSITDNAAASGAAVYYTGSGRITVTGSETKLQNNTATENGGAIFAAQGAIVLSDGASVSGNEAESLGGAIYAGNASITMEDEGTRLSGNTAKSGGAIYAQSSAITVSAGSITDNEATQGNGGAIYAGAGSVAVSGGSLSDNHAEAGNGGAIYAGYATVVMSGGTIGGSAANTAVNGAAVFMNTGSATFSGGRVTGNTAEVGGAVGIGSDAVKLYFTGSANITGNTASGAACNVYLDQDTDMVINADALQETANIGIYVPGSGELFKNRGDIGGRFGSYTGEENLSAFHNDRLPSFSVVKDANRKKVYWSSPVSLEVRYLESFNGGFPPAAAGNLRYTNASYAPVSSSTTFSELGDDLLANYGLNPGDNEAVYAAAFAESAAEYADYLTRLFWDNNDSNWKIEKRDGTQETLGNRKLILYFSKPAYFAIENNTEYDLDLAAFSIRLQNNDHGVINTASTPGYGLVFAKNGAIQTALMPLEGTADGHYILARGEAITLMIPGARDRTYSLSGSFSEEAQNYRRRITDKTGNQDTTVSGNAVSISGRSLYNNNETNQVIFGDDRYICKIVDSNGENRFSTIAKALEYARSNHMSNVKIEMLVDYLMPGSDVLEVEEADTFTALELTTAKSGTYQYEGEDRATISRANGNTAKPLISVRQSAASSMSVYVHDLNFDGKSVQGNIDGGAIQTKYCRVSVKNADFANFIANNGGAVFVSYGDQSGQSFVIPDGYDTGAEPSKAIAKFESCSFTNCRSKVTSGDRMGGGAVWSNGRLLDMRDCHFTACSAGLQAGAVFHRIEMERTDSFASSMQPYRMQSQTFVADCTFTDCSADKNAGGGIESDAFNVTMERSTFRNCVAKNSHGGGFNTYIAQKASGTSWGSEYQTIVNVTDCAFLNCTAAQDGGGFHSASNTTTVENSTFESCSSRYGGAIALNNGTAGTEQTADSGILLGVRIRNCTSTSQGGGIYANTKTLKVADYAYTDNNGKEQTVHSEVSFCTAGGNGGGIAHNRTTNDQQNSFTWIEGVTVSNCTSTWYGGGIFCASRNMTAWDSTIENCVSNGGTQYAEGGGGIYMKGNDNRASVGTVDHCTIRNNKAARYGGGLFSPCQLIICNDAEITGNTTEQAEWGAGVYLSNSNAGSLTIGTDNRRTAGTADNTTINNNMSISGIASNLRLPESGSVNANTVVVLCDLSGYIGVVNAKRAGTQFGQSPYSTDSWRPSGLSDSDSVFRSDSDTLHGIIDRVDNTGKRIIWAGPPICKLTDGDGNLLYFKANGSDPAIFDKLDDGTANFSRSSPFNLLRGNSIPLYLADGTRYTGTEYAIKMLVANYTAGHRIQLSPYTHISLTITTAGAADAEYPYTGRAGTSATVLRGTDMGNGNFLEFAANNNNNKNTQVLLTNITFDGNRSNVPSAEATRVLNLNGGNSMRVTLGPNAVLQNADNSTGQNGGAGVYVYKAILIMAGGVIRNCSGPIGGAVVIENGSNSVTGFILEAGSILNCTAVKQGGGVFVRNKGGISSFQMTGGTIIGCSAQTGGGVYIDNSCRMDMSGGSIVGNSAERKGGGIAFGGSSSKVYFSGKVTVSGNTSIISTAKERACNVELDQDSNAVINTNNGGLYPGSYIGVYVTSGNNLYDKHGQEGQPFGTFTEGDRTTNFYSFVNDRNMLKGGLIPDGAEHTIYWIKIFSLKVTKELEHNPQEEIEEGLRFRFKVTVSGTATVSGQLNAKDIDSSTGDYGEMIFHSDGQYQTISEEFYLAPGESITAVNLSEGLDYKVEEYLTDAQAKDYATRPSRVIVGKIGENKERTDVDPYTSDLVFTNILPVCKLTTASGNLLYQRVEVRSGDTMKSYNMPAVYTSLEDAFKAIEQAHKWPSDPTAQLYQGENVESSPKYGVEQGVSIEMLTNVSLNEPQTVYDWETVTLKTASKTANQFPFRVEGARMATVTRAYNGASMLTVFGSLTLDNITLDGAKAGYTGSTNGGAVSVETGATLAVNDSVIRNHQISAFDDGGAEINGAGVYVADGASLHLSGQLDFGGKGTNAAGAIIEGSGNYRLAALPAGSTNGRVPYSKPRQDIYLAESHENAPASILITGDLSGTDGSIWVWAYSAYHYKQNMPFARLADGVDGGNLRIFRDAREDSATENGTETWLYGTPEGDTAGYVYWSGVKGSRRVILRKVNGSLASLQGAAFDVYKGSPGGDVYLTIAANSNAFGILWAGDLPYGTYYLNETKTPEGYAGGWFCLVVDDPAKMNTDPEIRGPFNSAERAVEAAAEIQNAIRLAGNG